MKSIVVKLSLTEDIKDFVRITSKYSYDIDLKSGRYIIDAKSILGIFSLDLKQPITVEVHSDNCDDLLDELKQFQV
ncbi:MAG: HPr family phosphocarrier protein [Eubacteriales bacterium]